MISLALTLAVLGAPGASAQELEPCPAPDVYPAPFGDRSAVPEVHRFAVDCASWRQIVLGFDDNLFRPAAQVRRDQMASFVFRSLLASGVEPPPPTGERFADVDPGSPHDQAIHRLAAAGIVQGWVGGQAQATYGPALSMRRDQMATFLLRAVEFASREDLADQRQRFSDVPPGGLHFPNVNGAHEIGLARGFADGTFRPSAGVRRDQMAGFVVRLYERLRGADYTTMWFPVDLSGNESIRSGARYGSPGEALDALVPHLQVAPGAEVSQRITSWSATHGAVEIRAVPDDAISGEDLLVEFVQDAQGWSADPDARGRAHCRRGVSETDAAQCA